MSKKSLFRRNHVHDLLLLLAMVGASHATALSLSVGGGLFAVGLLVSAWSKLVLNRNSELITGGPYAICRHPFYLGNAIMDVGMCVMSGYPWLLVLFPFLFHVGYRRTFAYEEAQLKEWFPASHREFSRTTPLILPLGRRFFRDWRIGLNPARLLTEHVASRSLRHLAYPALIVLAFRLWEAPANWLNPINVALISTVVAVRILSRVLRGEFEKEGENEKVPGLVLALKKYPLTSFAMLVFLAVLIWEGGTLKGSIEALPWGLGMVFAEMIIRHYGRGFSSGLKRLAVLLPASVFGFGLLAFFEAVYLLPVAFALILCRVLLPPATAFHFGIPQKLVPVLATFGLLVSMSAIAVEIHLDGCVLTRLAGHLETVGEKGDWIVVLEDNQLSSLCRRTRIDDEVSKTELDLLLAQVDRTNGKRLIVVFDEADGERLSRFSRDAANETVFRTWTDSFRVLII